MVHEVLSRAFFQFVRLRRVVRWLARSEKTTWGLRAVQCDTLFYQGSKLGPSPSGETGSSPLNGGLRNGILLWPLPWSRLEFPNIQRSQVRNTRVQLSEGRQTQDLTQKTSTVQYSPVLDVNGCTDSPLAQVWRPTLCVLKGLSGPSDHPG
jgi:hypothetical protein